MSGIAERLREFRAAVGLTQREVASLCGLGKRTIIYWEMGEREIKCTRLTPLVDEYDLDFNWLILGRGSMFNTTLGSEDSDAEAPEDYDETEEEISEPVTDHIEQDWTEKEPIFQKEREDVLPLIQRLRRK